MSNALNISKLSLLAAHVANLVGLSNSKAAIDAKVAQAATSVNGATGVVVLSGTPVQVVETDFITVGTTTAVIPTDDTIPQITEGVEIMTAAITPKFATSTLYVEVLVNGAVNNLGSSCVAAVFQDSGVNALAAAFVQGGGVDFGSQVAVRFKVAAGSTTARTFRVRVGPGSAVTMTYNGNAGSRRFGGVNISSITITEILA